MVLKARLLLFSLLSIFIAFSAPSFAQTVSILPPTNTPPENTKPMSIEEDLSWGRFATAKGSNTVRYSWPMVHFSATFNGSEVIIDVEDDKGRFEIFIDDKSVGTFVKLGKKRIHIQNIAERRLGDPYHYITIERFNETQGNIANISIYGNYPIPPREIFMKQIIEFIGDSNTVGYGNMSSTRECTNDEVDATTDSRKSFASLLSRNTRSLVPDIVAASGRGVVRNYNGENSETLPELYPYALFDGKTPYQRSKYDQPPPLMIVIGLGTNDFSTPLNKDEKWKTRDELRADFIATYVAFVKNLRSQNPEAPFILWAHERGDNEALEAVRKVEAALKAEGETNLSLLVAKEMTYGGCHWHLDQKDHEKLRDLFINHIKNADHITKEVKQLFVPIK